MTTTVNTPIGVTRPVLWMAYASVLETTTQVYRTTSSDAPVVVYGPRPVSRAVQIVLLYDNETESRACEEMHAYGGISTITESGRATHSMQYVVTGQITRTLEPETARIWIVTIDAKEIP